jgi:hypothetical protein
MLVLRVRHQLSARSVVEEPAGQGSQIMKREDV